MQTGSQPSAAGLAVSRKALRAAEAASARARRNAQVRYLFVQRDVLEEPDPPLARMIRGGRGGQVRLKLYLSFLWMQTSDTGTPLGYPARAWATLFDLPDPEVAGARRITDAQAWLAEQGFITVATRPGSGNLINVLNESGSRELYTPAGEAANRERRETGTSLTHRYIQVPSTFWTNGYVTLLSGAAIAMFLALMCAKGATNDGNGLWFSPADARRRFALSEDTRMKGLRELVDAGLLRTRRQPVNPTDFDVRRMRNVHDLLLENLDEPARLQHVDRSDWSAEA